VTSITILVYKIIMTLNWTS